MAHNNIIRQSTGFIVNRVYSLEFTSKAHTTGAAADAEIQFANYIYLAMDQIVSELANIRSWSGNQW